MMCVQDARSLLLHCLLVCWAAKFIDSKRDGTEPFNGRREPRWTGRFDISSTGGAFGSVLQRARVMTETTRISAMEIRMSLANTRTPRKRSRRRKHSYRRMDLMVTESEKSKHDMLRAMRKHIRENGITDFTDFQDWCDENNDCWSLALDSGLSPVIEKYIDGRFY